MLISFASHFFCVETLFVNGALDEVQMKNDPLIALHRAKASARGFFFFCSRLICLVGIFCYLIDLWIKWMASVLKINYKPFTYCVTFDKAV